jgi:hypothetical protein
MEANEVGTWRSPRSVRVMLWTGASMVALAGALAVIQRHWLEAAKWALFAGGILLANIPPPRRRFLRYAGLAAVWTSVTITIVQLVLHRGR